MSIINSLSLINQNREILPQKNWNYFGKVLKCRTPSGRAFLTLYNPSHKIRRCQGTYCVHFSLFYTNVQFCTLFVNFWSCTLMYIGSHQEKKYKGYSFKTSQFSTIVAGGFQNWMWGSTFHSKMGPHFHKTRLKNFQPWIYDFRNEFVKIWTLFLKI